MRPFTASEVRGTYATLLLPIAEDDSIDFPLLRDQLDFFIAAGVDGVYSNGTAGEFYTQDEAEFLSVNQCLAERCEAAGVPFQIGASFPTPQLSLNRVRLARQFRPSAIQVILPDWWPPTLEESVVFLSDAAEAADGIPLVLYNPPHAKRVLGPAALATICARVPAIIGIKTAAGDSAWYDAMEPLLGRISVFVPGHTLATGISRGAAGAYSNVACLHPRGAVAWNRLIHANLEEALALERDIQRLMNAAIVPFRDIQGHSNMALDKLLACAGGWCGITPRLRRPYLGIDPREVRAVAERARRELPFLFENS